MRAMRLMAAHNEAAVVVINVDGGIHNRYAPGNEPNQHHNEPFITHKIPATQ